MATEAPVLDPAREAAERIVAGGGRRRGGGPTRRLLLEIASSRAGLFSLIVLGTFLVLAVLGPWIAPQDPTSASSFSTDLLAPPSSSHWLGTDENGRDVLSELLIGTRPTMIVGVVAALISAVIGSLVGITAGYFGRWVDRSLMLVDDWFLVLPFVPVSVLAATILGPRAQDLPMGQSSVLIIVIGVFGWAGTTRIVRAEVLSLRQRPFIERARALGASDWWIMRRHVLPNVMPLVLANTVLFVSLSILTASTLAYLGLGDPNGFDWGRMLAAANEAGAETAGAWAYFLAPGICITLVAVSFSLLGRSIEQRFSPKLQENR